MVREGSTLKMLITSCLEQHIFHKNYIEMSFFYTNYILFYHIDIIDVLDAMRVEAESFFNTIV
jgi:hypothetical protein